MTLAQREAFNEARRTLDKTSRFYAEDLAALESLYASKPDAECRVAIARFRAGREVTQAEIDMHCQFIDPKPNTGHWDEGGPFDPDSAGGWSFGLAGEPRQ